MNDERINNFMKDEIKVKVLGRLIPDSGKLHQNQEIYAVGGVSGTLKATSYKDPPKILVEDVQNE